MLWDTTVIEAALEELKKDGQLPPTITWRVETGPDATDTAAVWVWLTARDDELDSGMRQILRNAVRKAIRSKLEVGPWVYVRFRSATEVHA